MAIGKAIAIIGGVAVGAIGAYNFSSTGCFLGSCGTEESAASAPAVETVAATGESCALGCSMDSDAATLAVADTAECESACETACEEQVADSCCSSMSKGEALLVAAETAECGEDAGACCGSDKDACDADAEDCSKGEACCKSEELASSDG